MATKKAAPSRRPYTLGRRREQTDQTRRSILEAARRQLEAGGAAAMTLDGLARESGVTRQTVYNLFGTRRGVLEALFDQIALAGGMARMPSVMTQADPEKMLAALLEVFLEFWTAHRLLIRRIHGIAAIDPEFATVVEARNKRREMAASRVIPLLDAKARRPDDPTRRERIATLCALTSFEFFDALAESCGDPSAASSLLPSIVRRALA